MRKILVLAFLFVLVIPQLNRVEAYSPQIRQVLGVSIKTLDVPLVTDGTGNLKPDNPFYFLDIFRHNLESFLTFNPAYKSLLHTRVAGERNAELRVELIAGNKKAAEVALSEMTKNIALSTKYLTLAKDKGEYTDRLSVYLNDAIKVKMGFLSKVEVQLDGGERYKFKAARTDLLVDKIEVADILPANLSESEMAYDLKEFLAESINDSRYSAIKAQQVLGILSSGELNGQQPSNTQREVIKNAERDLNQTDKILNTTLK